MRTRTTDALYEARRYQFELLRAEGEELAGVTRSLCRARAGG